VHDDHLAFTAEVDDALHERQVDRRASRIVRKRNDEHAGLGPADFPRLVQRVEEIILIVGVDVVGRQQSALAAHRNLAQIGAGKQRPKNMDWIARARHDRRIARLEQHPHQVAESFLRADRVGDLQFGVERDAELALVHAGDCLAQLGQTARQRIAMVLRIVRGFGEFFHRDLRRRNVGVTETEVDYVVAVAARSDLQIVDDREDVRRQVADATKFHEPSLRGSVRESRQQGCADRAGMLAELRDAQVGMRALLGRIQQLDEPSLDDGHHRIGCFRDSPTDHDHVGV